MEIVRRELSDEEVEDFLDQMIRASTVHKLESNLVHWNKGWQAAINKVLSKIESFPISPQQKKFLWKEVKKLK